MTINEQVKELRTKASIFAENGFDLDGIVKSLNDAADTIESLSAKLQSANMERSTEHFVGGWIPCIERLPDKSGSYLVTTYSSGISQYISDVDQFVYNGMPDGYWMNGEDVIAWQPLPEPYKPQ